MKRMTLGFIAIFAMIIISLCLANCTRKSAQAVSEWHGGLEREWQVNRAEMQRYSYEYFYDKYAAIKGAADSLQFLDAEKDRLEIVGIKMNIAKWINEYNEDAQKFEGMARYKDRGLPSRLRLEDFNL